jgi:hypothetical protein
MTAIALGSFPNHWANIKKNERKVRTGMNRLLLSGLALALLTVIVSAIPTSALTAVTLTRPAQAEVVSDNSTAAVHIECINNSGGLNYSNVCDYGATGAVTLRLKNGIGGSATGFNPAASFTIGSTNQRVVKVTNNSMIPVKVWLDGSNSQLKMYDAGGTLRDSNTNAASISSGASQEFYFTVDTTSASSGQTLSATLHVTN